MSSSCPSMRMEDPLPRIQLRLTVPPIAALALSAAAFAGGPADSTALADGGLPAPMPAVSDYQLLSSSTTPPAESACFAIGRRCFTASTMQNSYNLPPLYAAGNQGQWVTI